MIKQSLLLVKVFALAFFALFSIQSFAALGQMRVVSEFGEPLNVEISLTGNTGKNYNSVHIGNIVNGEFVELRPFSITEIGQVNVSFITRNKARVLLVKSTLPLKVPVFRFAVQEVISSGSIVREYSVALNPPGYLMRSSMLYHRYSGQDLVVLSSNRFIRRASANLSPSTGHLLPVNLVVASKNAQSSAPSSDPSIDKTLIELENQVNARDKAIKEHNKELEELSKEVNKLKQRMESSSVIVSHNKAPIDSEQLLKNNAHDSAHVNSSFSLYQIAGIVVGVVIILLLSLILVLQLKKRKGDDPLVGVDHNDNGKFSLADTSTVKQSGSSILSSSNISQMASQRQVASSQATFMTDFTQMSGAIDTGEVDPIAEAEVYIAYGRDTQAEDILLDALRQDPSRHEVRMKLMEFYASKLDLPHFETLAHEMYNAFDGHGALWAKTAALGASIDPENSFYKTNEFTVGSSHVPKDVMTIEPSSISLDDDLLMSNEPLIKSNNMNNAHSEFILPNNDGEEDNGLLSALFSDLDTMPSNDYIKEDEKLKNRDSLLDFDSSLPFNNQSDDANSLVDPILGYNFDDASTINLSDVTSQSNSSEVSNVLTSASDSFLTEMDLAKVYLDMGDKEGAKDILNRIASGSEGVLRDKAITMLAEISS